MIKKLTILCSLMLLLVSCAGTDTQPQKSAETVPSYRIGYMICNSTQETKDRFIPFNTYMSQKMGVNFEPVYIDTTKFVKQIDTLDFTHTNSLIYIMLHKNHGVEILAAEQKGSLGSRSRGVIITLEESDIETIADLKGKSMLFGPTLAPTGFMSQVDVLQKNGIDPEDDLGFYTIPSGSWKHEKVVYGVLFEMYDAGSLPLEDIENMTAAGRISEDDFRIIGQGPDMPYCNFAVNPRVDKDFAKRFKDILLAITPEDTVVVGNETVRVLKEAKIDGYEDITDAEFDVVRDVARRTNMPPYQKY